MWTIECYELNGRKVFQAMDARAIPTEIASSPLTASQREAAPPAGGGSFENHLNSALQNAGQASSPGTQQSAKDSKKRHPEPSPSHLPNSYPGVGPNIMNSLSPGLMGTSGAFEDSSLASGLQTSPSGSAHQPASESRFFGPMHMAPEAQAQQKNHTGKDATAKSGSADDETGTVPQLPASNTPGAENALNMMAENGRFPTSSGQDSAQIQKALASMESMGLLGASASISVGRGSIDSALQSKAGAVSPVAGRGPAVNTATTAKSLSPKVAEETTAGAGKGSQPASSSAPQAASGNGDSAAPAKASSGPSGDNSRNTSSRDNSGKPGSPGSAQASGSSEGANTSTASAMAQVASSSFPQALNQAAPTGTPISHAGSPTQPTAAQPGAPDKIAAAIDNPVNAPNAAVSGASLVGSQGKAEMRVAMQTDSLGALQLHAVLDNGRLGASIQVVSHDAHTLLSNDLPALQQVLTDHNLRVDHLAVINSPMTSGAGGGDRHSFQSEDFSQRENPNTRWPSSPAAPAASTRSVEASALENLRGRLSVRA
jgi:hypothetical protein